MRRFFSILTVLTLNIVYCQTHKAIYSLKIEPQLNSVLSEIEEVANLQAESNEFYLYFNKEQSYYTSLNIENNIQNLSDAYAGTYDPKKYNYKLKTLTYNIEFDKIYVYNDANLPTWIITNETKQIAGYTCYKAIGTYKSVVYPEKKSTLEAWFVPEIPYSTGPNQYNNLPGLLVYGIINNTQILKLEKIIFNDNTVDIDDVKFKGEQLSKENYMKFTLDVRR